MKPFVLIGSPMCTMFSQLQSLSGWNDKKEERWVHARDHLKFVVTLYWKQVEGGRVFVHEHPAGASSWELPEMRELMRAADVRVVRTDQCMLGLTTKGDKGNGQASAMKPTKFITNG